MKTLYSIVATLAPAALVVAQDGEHHAPVRRLHHQARQGTSSSPPPVALPPPATAGTGTGTVLAPSTTGAGPAPGTSLAPTSSLATTYTFSLAATNPTAVPLASITAAQSSYATLPLDSTATPGSKPSSIPGAPALPNIATLSPSNYPALDKPPPIDSPEVQQWKQEVLNSGISIPGLEPTNPGGCANNTAIATDPSRCWWSCTGCTGDKDITQCPDPLSWGLTYDDGPGYYTSNLLHYLDEKALKSTFFVVGSRVISFPGILQTQYIDGHQIGVHTWSHQPLTTQSNDQIIAELGWTKKVIKDVLGVTPNMMRPPFGDIDNRVRAISLAMGLAPVIWTRNSATSTFDTDDFNIHNGVTPVQKVLQNWQNILDSAESLDHGFIVLEHDLFEESVEVATGYILPDALAHNPPFKIQPVVSCLGRSLSDAYIETNDNKTNPPPNPTAAASGSGGGGEDTSKSEAVRQYPLHPMVVTGLIIGVSGFAVGLFTAQRV